MSTAAGGPTPDASSKTDGVRPSALLAPGSWLLAPDDASKGPKGPEHEAADRPIGTRRLVWQFGLLPLLVYTLCLFLLTFPLLLYFPTHYFTDSADGLQMVWSVWWVDQAVTTHGQLPWQTHLLYYPGGVTLLLHSLTPFNGFLGIPLLRVMPLVQAYNSLYVFAFVSSGLTAFWLAWYATRAYWPSLAAGYAFTFCASHFAHAHGHLNQISTQFLPLFLLLLLLLLDRPTVVRALAAALTLLLALLCDHYFFLYCVGAGVLVIAWRALDRDQRRAWGRRRSLAALGVFLVASLVAVGPLVLAIVRAASGKALENIHDPTFYSTDLLGPLIPGWAWHYHDLTRPYWSAVGSVNETSVSIGLAVLAAAAAGWWLRRRLQVRDAGLWLILGLVCYVLSLGPALQFMGQPLVSGLPYAWLEHLLPPLRVSGVPVRLMVMTQLAAAVLAAGGLKALRGPRSAGRMGLAMLFVLALVVESLPRLQSMTPATVPAWVTALRDLPVPGPVLELRHHGAARGLYYQTVHGRPMAFGEIARRPLEAIAASEHAAALAAARDFDALRQLGFRLLVVGVSAGPQPLPLLYEDREVRIYALGP